VNLDSLTVRAAVPADAPRLAQLLAGGSLRGAETPGDPAAYVDAMTEIQDTPGNEVLLAELDGQVVGMCQLTMFRHLQEAGGRCAEIESVHVDERYRGRGIGGVLLNAAVDAARRSGCYRVQLTSHKARVDAHRFYLGHGFDASHEGFKLYL
jgi:GNAT superfamily N-acetyltransferase